PDCPLRGSLHGHHPRDCLSYLRDWEPLRLQRLLQERKIQGKNGGFGVKLGHKWGNSGGIWLRGSLAILGESLSYPSFPLPWVLLAARGHYSEYLVGLVNRHGLDPAPLYDSAELRAAAERHLA
ncbi:RNF31 ligase, partial [Neodrepanis coruscans]|nr:RNF31 ligase [Neodrepanis coruscans]